MAIPKLLARMSLIISLTLVTRLVSADTLVTNGGSKFEGKISYNDSTKTYVLETANGGKMTFPAAVVSEVKKDAPSPPQSMPKEGQSSSEFPLQTLVREVSKYIEEIQADPSLTTAQKNIRIQNEVNNVKGFIEGREWPFDSTLVDIKDSEVPGSWHVVLDLHVPGLDPLDAEMPLPDQVVESTKKGTPIKVLVKFVVQPSASSLRLAISGIALAKEEKAATLLEKPVGMPVAFFGVCQVSAHKVVYIVDRSGSMTDSINAVKYELKRSIGELDENTEFHVIFYSSGPPVEMPTRRLVNATERNKQLAFEFIDGVVPQGETDPSKALERAFACGPELIYLLTDGEFDKTIVGLVKRLNVGGKITVHTIGFLYQSGEAVLKQIAEGNGGNYKFVSESDLPKLEKAPRVVNMEKAPVPVELVPNKADTTQPAGAPSPISTAKLDANTAVAAAFQKWIDALEALAQGDKTDIQWREGWLVATREFDSVLRGKLVAIEGYVEDVTVEPRSSKVTLGIKSVVIKSSEPSVPDMVIRTNGPLEIAATEDESKKITKSSTVIIKGYLALAFDLSKPASQQPADRLYKNENGYVSIPGGEMVLPGYKQLGSLPESALPKFRRRSVKIAIKEGATITIDGTPVKSVPSHPPPLPPRTRSN